MKRKLKGFTLVELVITIAIVIILSVVSVPIYQGYTKKAKMAEGYALLGQILSAQKAYYSEYGNFLWRANATKTNGKCWATKEDVLGIDARGNKYFTLFNIGSDMSNVGGLKGGFLAFAVKAQELGGSEDADSMICLALQYSITDPSKTFFSDNFGGWD